MSINMQILTHHCNHYYSERDRKMTYRDTWRTPIKSVTSVQIIFPKC